MKMKRCFTKEEIEFILADFVVYNNFVGDKRDFNIVKKNAKEFLKEVRWNIKELKDDGKKE